MTNIELSKIVSHALRHAPELYGLTVDKYGWIKLLDLENALIKQGITISCKEIINMVDSATKKRHEIDGDRIRARYGHTLPIKVVKEVSEPPEVLFHGTIRIYLADIQKNGLLPMLRQYVHLSSNESDAQKVASRKPGDIVILRVLANIAFKNGVNFYKEKENVWLSDPIPSRFIAI